MANDCKDVKHGETKLNDEHETMLVIRCQLGETEAWEDLVKLWHPRLYQFVSRMVGTAQVDDLVQNIWVRLIRSLGCLGDPASGRAWMYQVARNSVMDRLRSQYRQPTHAPLPDVSIEPDDQNNLEEIELVEMYLSNLHPVEREVTVLFYLEERPVEEIARVCGIPQGTVKSRLYRARKRIREQASDE